MQGAIEAMAENRVPTSAKIEAFSYPAVPGEPYSAAWEGWEEPQPAPPAEESHPPAPAVSEAALRAEFERRLGEETRRSFEAGREKGCQEGRAQEREAQAAANAAAEERRVRQAAELAQRFLEEHNRYFEEVEREVVELALAVAARILRRESQMDPLLLTGAVRVALGQLSNASSVALRVPQSELDLWSETIAALPNLKTRPRVEVGEGMRQGDCTIVAETGSVDLGLRAQMAEIERGFFDRGGRGRGNPAQEPRDTEPSE